MSTARSVTVLLALALMSHTSAALALDCKFCATDAVCPNIEECVNRCKVPAQTAQKCLLAGKLLGSLTRCKAIYPPCDGIDPAVCNGCKSWPRDCQNIEKCVNQCKIPASKAQECYEAVKISLDQLKKICPQCKGQDPACSVCLDVDAECKNIELCVQKCQYAPSSAAYCYESKAITLERCNKLYNRCQCENCSSYPANCSKIETCIKQCNLAQYAAQSCYKAGMIGIDQCKKLYPACK